MSLVLKPSSATDLRKVCMHNKVDDRALCLQFCQSSRICCYLTEGRDLYFFQSEQ